LAAANRKIIADEIECRSVKTNDAEGSALVKHSASLAPARDR